jgi:hypothetical protein
VVGRDQASSEDGIGWDGKEDMVGPVAMMIIYVTGRGWEREKRLS